MVTILQHFRKGNLKGETMSRCHQLVAVAKRWSGHMGHLLANYMPHPCIVLSVLEEVALYADIQQVEHQISQNFSCFIRNDHKVLHSQAVI